MIRVLVFLIIVAALAFGAVWLADRPGDVTLTWLGYHLETSVMVLFAAVAAITVIAMVSWSILRGIVRSPRALADHFRRRRDLRARSAITRGLVAIGSGDAAAARRYANEAKRLAPDAPLALLLTAQSAQLAGDKSTAERSFRQMAGRADTKLLGLHGLYVEAQRRDDAANARLAAEEAAKTDPSLAWAAQAVLDFRCADRDWVGALAALDRNMKSGLTDKPTYRRQRAVLLTARALSRGDTDRDTAKSLVAEAVKLCPGLIPAAALAGRLHAEDGDARKAGRVIEAAWRENPHPDLAEAYAHLKPGDSARDRLTRMQALARLAPNHPEGALAVTRAAIDAHEFVIARETLAPLLKQPTQRAAQLMAEIEEGETGDVGRSREWMGRALLASRDPSWTTDGMVSGKWLPVSPATGRLDAFEWKVPLADLNPPGPVIDEPRAVALPSVVAPPPAPVVEEDVAVVEDDPRADKPMESAVVVPHRAAPPPPIIAPAPSTAPAAASRPAETVIPLIHVPDDPGPEPEEAEPVAEPPQESWQRLRKLFR